MQVFTMTVQVLVSGAKHAAQAVQDYVSDYVHRNGSFSVSDAAFSITHAHSASEVTALPMQGTDPVQGSDPTVNYMYSVYYGTTGYMGALLGGGSTLHGAKVAALMQYNDEQCGVNRTWEQMVNELALTDYTVLIVCSRV